ncbi:zinc-finger associated domain containing protein, partial [Oryctes borbonicus]
MQRANISLLCRTCLKGEGNIYPLSFTSTGHENINFATMLMSCTAVCIQPNDSLPYQICEKCLCILIMAYNFKEQCEKSDLFLRRRDRIKLKEIKLDDLKITLTDTIGGDTSVTTHVKSNDKIKAKKGNVETRNIKNAKPIEMVFIKHEQKQIDTMKSTAIKKEHSYNSKEGSKRSEVKYKRKPGIYKCSKCDKILTTRYGYMYHMRNHSEGKSFACPVEDCKRKFSWKPTLKRHMLVHSNEKQFLCYICGVGYSAADSFWYHLKSHQDQRPYLCTCCGKSYKQAIHLKYHMHSHTG